MGLNFKPFQSEGLNNCSISVHVNHGYEKKNNVKGKKLYIYFILKNILLPFRLISIMYIQIKYLYMLEYTYLWYTFDF